MKASTYHPSNDSYLDVKHSSSSAQQYIPHDALYFLKLDAPEVPGMVSEPLEVYGAVEQGYAFHELQALVAFLGFTQMELSRLFEVDASTLSRWKKQPKPIGLLRSRLVRELDAMVAKGVRLFGTEPAFSAWLDAPHAHLSGATPRSFLSHPEGVLFVDDLLEGLSWGQFG